MIHRKGEDVVPACMELSAQIGSCTAPTGSLLKIERLSFNRSEQGSDQESAVCQGMVKTLRPRLEKH